MARPLILYGLLPLLNSSFEADADGVQPSSWSLSGTGAVAETSTAQYHSAGDGLPSVKSAMLTTTNPQDPGLTTRLQQRIFVTSVPAWARSYKATSLGGPMVAVAAMKYATDNVALSHSRAKITPYSSTLGSTTPGTGTPLTGCVVRRYVQGTGVWQLEVFAIELPASAEAIDVSLEYDGNAAALGYSAVYYDRLFVGQLLDLEKGFSKLSPEPDNGYRINEGNGSVELVKVRTGRTDLKVTISNVADGSADDRRLKLFQRWQNALSGACAFWFDRDAHTNEGLHFQQMYLKPDQMSISIPSGVLRREYSYQFVAPSECL